VRFTHPPSSRASVAPISCAPDCCNSQNAADGEDFVDTKKAAYRRALRKAITASLNSPAHPIAIHFMVVE
jgi:hypothetical protein